MYGQDYFKIPFFIVLVILIALLVYMFINRNKTQKEKCPTCPKQEPCSSQHASVLNNHCNLSNMIKHKLFKNIVNDKNFTLLRVHLDAFENIITDKLEKSNFYNFLKYLNHNLDILFKNVDLTTYVTVMNSYHQHCMDKIAMKACFVGNASLHVDKIEAMLTTIVSNAQTHVHELKFPTYEEAQSYSSIGPMLITSMILGDSIKVDASDKTNYDDSINFLKYTITNGDKSVMITNAMKYLFRVEEEYLQN